MRISLDKESAKSPSHSDYLEMKPSSSMHRVSSSSDILKFGSQLLKWRRGLFIFLSLLLIFCIGKVYMSSLLYDPDLKALENRHHSHTTGTEIIQLEEFYGIMIDAGSTGSRVHVYQFKRQQAPNPPILVDELFEQIKPGLSSFTSDAREGAESIKHLLDIAKERVPPQFWSSTPLALKATAGLRMLPKEQSDNLLNEVTNLFHEYPFVLPKESVIIMDGELEGKYGWTTVNYLLQRLGGANSQFTVGTIDLGGGSMQITFAPHDYSTVETADEGFISEMTLFGRTGKVYTHSYLGMGLMSAREILLGGPNKGETVEVRSACMPDKHSETWKNAMTSYNINGATGIDNTRYELCRDSAKKAVLASGIKQPKEIRHQPFYVFSYFFDRAEEAGLVDSENGGTMTVQNYSDAAQKYCHDDNFDKAEPFFCMDLCLLAAILEEGFGFASDTELVSQKKIAGKETSWTLGATFDLMNDTE